jgi:hypothetical protein
MIIRSFLLDSIGRHFMRILSRGKRNRRRNGRISILRNLGLIRRFNIKLRKRKIKMLFGISCREKTRSIIGPLLHHRRNHGIDKIRKWKRRRTFRRRKKE